MAIIRNPITVVHPSSGDIKTYDVVFQYLNTATCEPVVEKQTVMEGESAIPPTAVGNVVAIAHNNPDLTFDGWLTAGYDYTNVQKDLVLTARYHPTDGNTYICVVATQETGSIYQFRATNNSGILTVDFDDGEQPVYTPNTGFVLLQSNNYDYGKRLIKISTTGSFDLTGYTTSNWFMIVGPQRSSQYSIQSMFVGDNVSIIGGYSLFDANSLRILTMSSGVTTLSDAMCLYAFSLNYLSMSQNITYIGDICFKIQATGNTYDNSNLAYVTLPNNLTYLGKESFYYHRNLINITIPQTITEIKDGTFYYCQALRYDVLSDNNITSIGRAAFNYCKSIKKLTLTNNLTYIGDVALAQTSIEELTIPESATIISGSINNNANLAKLTINCELTKLETNLFSGNNALYDLTFKYPNSITTIMANAFSNCRSLSYPNFPNVTSIGNYAFSNIGLTKSIDLLNVSSLGNYCFNNSTIYKVKFSTAQTSIPSLTSNSIISVFDFTRYTINDTPPTLSSYNNFFSKVSNYLITFSSQEVLNLFASQTNWSNASLVKHMVVES